MMLEPSTIPDDTLVAAKTRDLGVEAGAEQLRTSCVHACDSVADTSYNAHS